MAATRDLVREYEPVLRFSTDGQGRSERFFPLAARHYVHSSGLRRRRRGWESSPGRTRLRHLGWVREPQHCYLAYAAGELDDDQVLLRLLDQGLELARPRVPRTPPGDREAEGLEPKPAPAEDAVVPRVLVTLQEAEALQRQLSTRGGAERRALTRDDLAPVLNGTSESAPGMAPERAREMERALAAGPREWVIPRGLAALPAAILRRAQEKYEPYRDWRAHPPVYHTHVCHDRGYRVLQYWFLYAYNDWAAHGGANDHEGDWEVIMVFLDALDEPRHVAYSRHVTIPGVYEPLTAPWEEVETVQVTHPVVYVGCGSHASYPHAGTHRILWRLDYALGDDVAIGPGTDQAWGPPVRLDGRRWNRHFSGNWGSLVKSWLGMVLPGTGGPTGPAHKGDKWERPASWAGLVGIG